MDSLVVGIRSKKVSWILDADIEKFFDTVNQQRLMRFVEHTGRVQIGIRS